MSIIQKYSKSKMLKLEYLLIVVTINTSTKSMF